MLGETKADLHRCQLLKLLSCEKAYQAVKMGGLICYGDSLANINRYRD